MSKNRGHCFVRAWESGWCCFESLTHFLTCGVVDSRWVITLLRVLLVPPLLAGSMEARKCVKTIHNYRSPKWMTRPFNCSRSRFTFQNRPSNIQALVWLFVFICVEFFMKIGRTSLKLVGGLDFFHILGMSSSQLTNSYFSGGLKPPSRKPFHFWRRPEIFLPWCPEPRCWPGAAETSCASRCWGVAVAKM